MENNKSIPTICSRGHKFLKSTMRPVCPKCYPGYYRKKEVKNEAK